MSPSESFYDILGVNPTSSFLDIKQAYQRLILIHHPDKSKNDIDSHQFTLIHKAYETLRNPEKRSLYDKSINFNQDIGILDIIDLDDMEIIIPDEQWSYQCRCSGNYIITSIDMQQGINIVQCDTCSLKISISYTII